MESFELAVVVFDTSQVCIHWKVCRASLILLILLVRPVVIR
jgi:hypothetical protein